MQRLRMLVTVASATFLVGACTPCPEFELTIDQGIVGSTVRTAPYELGGACFGPLRAITIVPVAEAIDEPEQAQRAWDARSGGTTIAVRQWYERRLDDGLWMACGFDDASEEADCFDFRMQPGVIRELMFEHTDPDVEMTVRDDETGVRLETMKIAR